MKKIGILTFHRAINYGACLQAYALKKYIKDQGNECDIIDYHCPAIEDFYGRVFLREDSFKTKIKKVLTWSIQKKRKKRFIKLLGNRISLDETEELLNQAFPETEFVCAGTDEQMKVFCTGDIGDEKAIISYLSDKLHLFYKNFSVRKIKKIPRNTSGKVLYEQLEEQ